MKDTPKLPPHSKVPGISGEALQETLDAPICGAQGPTLVLKPQYI